VSFALALRNQEGVLLATDTAAWKIDAGQREYVLHDKLRWFPGQRAACALFPVWANTSLLVESVDDIGPLSDTADIRASALAVYRENLPLHISYIAESPTPTPPSWLTPQLAVVAYPPSGPRLLSITDGSITERSDQSLDVETLGAWNELGPCEPRVLAAPWGMAENMAGAKLLARNLMTEYIADYDRSKVWERTPQGHQTIGGPVCIATITKNRITVDTYGRNSH
jgi:hypothetical protein